MMITKLHVDYHIYRQVSNIRHTLAGNKVVDHSNIVGASPVGAAPTTSLLYPPATKLGGVYWIHPVCLSVCLSVCSLTFRVRPVASTVHDRFFPYLVQMINSLRGYVACDDPFGLDLENRVRPVASTVLDGFFLYLAQMITIIRGCVACYVFFRIWKFEFLANLKKKFRPWPWKKIYSSQWILSIFSTNDH